MNTETKQFEGHTPGPYEIHRVTGDTVAPKAFEIFAGNQQLATVMLWPEAEQNAKLFAAAPELLTERNTLASLLEAGDGLRIAQVAKEAQKVAFLQIELQAQKEANAELLEALKFLFSDNNPRMFSDSSEQKTKAAIAKAERGEHAS